MICTIKKYLTFALELTMETSFKALILAVFFISANQTNGLGCCFSSGSRYLALLTSPNVREQQSFFILNIFNQAMETSIKNASRSSITPQSTPDCESVNPNVLPSRQKLTVSETTYAYLKCLQQLDTLFACMYEALELDYGWKAADQIMQDEYSSKSCAIRDMINSYMCVSIGENINSRSEITEI